MPVQARADPDAIAHGMMALDSAADRPDVGRPGGSSADVDHRMVPTTIPVPGNDPVRMHFQVDSDRSAILDASDSVVYQDVVEYSVPEDVPPPDCPSVDHHSARRIGRDFLN